jgi:hypothetical protein
LVEHRVRVMDEQSNKPTRFFAEGTVVTNLDNKMTFYVPASGKIGRLSKPFGPLRTLA